jgi:hypothetical protein
LPVALELPLTDNAKTIRTKFIMDNLWIGRNVIFTFSKVYTTVKNVQAIVEQMITFPSALLLQILMCWLQFNFVRMY